MGKQNNMHGLMALAGETAKMAQNMIVLDKTEAALEKELEKEENRKKPTSKIGKARHKGERLLHSKYVLLMVVILNLLDCLLVLGELMLDIKYVTDLLSKELDRSEEFVGSMRGLHPDRLGYLGPKDIQSLEHELLIATITWDDAHGSHRNHSSLPADHNTLEPHTTKIHSRRKRENSHVTSDGTTDNKIDVNSVVSDNGSAHANGQHLSHTEHAHGHSIEEDVAHALHKASITILGILVVETFVKVFCFGKEMLEHKLECFDSVIVVASFIVDLVFLKGLQQFTVQEFVLILAIMVPWRIIRVVNSLVVAIMDHEHFRLKLLYKQKKKISNELKEAKEENDGLAACVDVLKKLCTQAGIPETQVEAKLNLFRKVKAKSNVTGALGNFAIGGKALDKPFMNGDKPNNVADVSIAIENNDVAKESARVFENELTTKKSNVIANLNEQTIDVCGSPTSLASDNSRDDLLNKHLQNTRRPRSQSALDPREAAVKKSDNLFLHKIALNTAGFIATMNKDEVDQSEGNKSKITASKTLSIPFIDSVDDVEDVDDGRDIGVEVALLRKNDEDENARGKENRRQF